MKTKTNVKAGGFNILTLEGKLNKQP
jgi:hypothetical protein